MVDDILSKCRISITKGRSLPPVCARYSAQLVPNRRPSGLRFGTRTRSVSIRAGLFGQVSSPKTMILAVTSNPGLPIKPQFADHSPCEAVAFQDMDLGLELLVETEPPPPRLAVMSPMSKAFEPSGLIAKSATASYRGVFTTQYKAARRKTTKTEATMIRLRRRNSPD